MDVVECRSDTEYAERPLALTWNGQHYEINKILARWRGPDERSFRVQTTSGLIFDITYREIPDEWKIKPI